MKSRLETLIRARAAIEPFLEGALSHRAYHEAADRGYEPAMVNHWNRRINEYTDLIAELTVMIDSDGAKHERVLARVARRHGGE